MTAEQERYLAEGIRHRATYYGTENTPPGGHLTLALAWWAAYWRQMADHAEVRRLAPDQSDLFDGGGA